MTYNSIGAGASVNHLHFQVFLQTKPLAMFAPGFVHNGGNESYPASCRVFEDINQCWLSIQQLHAANTPYNLIFRHRKIFCFSRTIPTRTVPTRTLPAKTFTEFNPAAYGWSEMAGVFTLNNLDTFNQVSLDLLMETVRSVSAETMGCQKDDLVN